MKTLPDDAETDQIPTDFTQYLARRLELTPNAADQKLGAWLLHYVPLKHGSPDLARGQRSPSRRATPADPEERRSVA